MPKLPSILYRLWFFAGIGMLAASALAQPSGGAPGGNSAGGQGGPGGGQGPKGGPGGGASGGGNGGERPHGPPREAVDACRGLASGAACSFNGREGQKLTGTCSGPPPRPQAGASGPSAGKGGPEGAPPLACRPEHGGGPGGASGGKDAPKR